MSRSVRRLPAWTTLFLSLTCPDMGRLLRSQSFLFQKSCIALSDLVAFLSLASWGSSWF
ncbi:MAG: hypothetical protein ACTSUC_01395 [Promethearchaeota archaeon]